MYRLIRRINLVRIPPLLSPRFSSSSSQIVLHLKSANEQNPVIAFFKNHGFSKSQISVIVKKMPRLLSAKPEKILLPKLLFLQSKGLSSPEVTKLLSAFPYILNRSLNRHIIPSFVYFHDLLQSNENTIAAIKRFVGLLHVDLRSSVRPNIEILRQIGVPDSNIATIFRFQPRLFSLKTIRFEKSVEEVKEMGFNPIRFGFVYAVSVLQSMSKCTWKKKVEVYRKWGWSEEEVVSAFGRHPGCMIASENKINGVMDYFVNQIGYESSFIARNPTLVTLSLKSRIVPRGSVYQVLLSEGLIKKHAKYSLLFYSNEKRFLNSFIKPYEERIPRLLKLYEEKLEVCDRGAQMNRQPDEPEQPNPNCKGWVGLRFFSV